MKFLNEMWIEGNIYSFFHGILSFLAIFILREEHTVRRMDEYSRKLQRNVQNQQRMERSNESKAMQRKEEKEDDNEKKISKISARKQN